MMDIPTISNHPDGNICWAFSDILKRNPKNKREELETLAEMGCTEAMVYLGVMLVDDISEGSRAMELFEKAAEAGDPMGMRNMGYCYALGIAVEKDSSKAAEWYRRAALAGNENTQCNK